MKLYIIIKLSDNYYCANDLIAETGKFGDYHNHRRYQDSLHNVTPADAHAGRAATIQEQRE